MSVHIEHARPAPSLGVRLKTMPSIYYALAALVLFVIVFSIGNSAFFSLFNFNIIVLSAVILLTAGIDQCWPIVTGGIDLSVGGLISLVSVVFMLTVAKLGYWSYPLCLCIGAAMGYLNGVLLTRVRIPSFIATLGTGGIFVSLAYVLSPKAISAPFNRDYS